MTFSKLAALACCAGLLQAASGADPNFAGSWKLNLKKSQIRALPASPADPLKVDHRDRRIEYTAPARRGEAAVCWAFTTDGKEIRAQAGSNTIRNRAKWEGDDLLTNSTISSPGSAYTQMDHWHISRDGKRLTIEREIVNRAGEMDSTLVYERIE